MNKEQLTEALRIGLDGFEIGTKAARDKAVKTLREALSKLNIDVAVSTRKEKNEN